MESSEIQKKFLDFIEDQKKELSESRRTLLNETASSEPLKLHDVESIELLLHNKLQLESELEAFLSSDSKLLPDDEEILLNIAAENSLLLCNHTSRALEYQKTMNLKLNQEKKNLQELITYASDVSSKLDDLIENRNEVDYVNTLKYKYESCSKKFRELREEFGWYLGSRFSSEDEASSMERILEVATKKFLDDPDDPYVEYDESNELVEFLIKANILIRHPMEFMKFKLMNFTRGD